MPGASCSLRSVCAAFVGVATLTALTLTAPTASAVVLIDTDFTAADGYLDGSILFQQPSGADNGIWLGQSPSSANNPDVDSVAGVVNTAGGAGSAGGGNFRRNTWSLGAVGGTLGGDGSNETNQAGFEEGDRIKIDVDYQFTLGASPANSTFLHVGVKDCFVTCGFEASPFAGLEVAYNDFEDGTIKVFSNLLRAGSNGADNPFGLFVGSADIGLDNGFTSGGPVDSVSDNLSFSYEAELVDASLDLWQATEVIVTNLDTETVVGQASLDNPAALETFIWNSTAVDDPFTPDVNEGGVARGDGSDMFFGIQWIHQGADDDLAAIGGVRFEYIPVNGNPDPFPGDANGDGTVDLLDLDILGANFGTMGTGTFETGDFNGDGNVDLLDLDILGGNFGNSASSSAIPEPTTVALAGFALAAASLRRRNG